MLVDTHCHLGDAAFSADRAEVTGRAFGHVFETVRDEFKRQGRDLNLAAFTSATGSAAVEKTIGIVVVAAFAASADCVPAAAITAT